MREERGRQGWIFVAFLVLAILATGYFATVETSAKVSSPGRSMVNVGTNTPFPPFEYNNSGKIEGFDVDLIQAILGKSKQLTIKDFNDFDALFPGIAAGKLDLIASAVTIRSERKEVADFSDPYFSAAQSWLGKKGRQLQISGVGNLAGLTIGCQEGTTSELWVRENVLDPKVEIKEYKSFGDLNLGLKLLVLGDIDLILLDEPVANTFAKQDQRFQVYGKVDTGENYGFAVQKGDPKGLLPIINKKISEMKANGEYSRLIQKWFGGSR